MKTSLSPRKSTSGSSVFTLQAGLVAAAAIGAGAIVTTTKPIPPADSSSPPADSPKPPAENRFDMLAYMDEKVGVRESDKDVRCWSSFTELQIFITQCKISPEAKGARTRLHAEIIESIWRDAREEQGDGKYIGEAALAKVLQTRFPSRETPEGVQFEFGGGERPRVQLVVLEKDKRDYEQTIEPWRLLQNWATAHIDKKGQLTLQPPFDKPALELMYRFLRSFDLAILKKAGEAAKADRLSEITAESVAKAFRAVQQKPD